MGNDQGREVDPVIDDGKGEVRPETKDPMGDDGNGEVRPETKDPMEVRPWEDDWRGDNGPDG